MKLAPNKTYITRDGKRAVYITEPGNIPGTFHGRYLGNDEDTHWGTWTLQGFWLSDNAPTAFDLVEELSTTL